MPETSVIALPAPARLLLIDASGTLGARLAPAFESEFAVPPDVVELTGGRQALDLLRGSTFDAIAADLTSLSDLSDNSDERIGRLARVAAGALIVVLVEDASLSRAMAAMRAGAHDCLGASCDAATLIERLGTLARRSGKSRVMVRSVVESEVVVESVAPEPSIPVMRDLVLPMWRQEQKIIENAIQSFAGNIALAAAALELSPSTIYRKRQAWAEMDQRRAEMATAISAR